MNSFVAWITPRDAVASKLMQSTARTMTRPAHRRRRRGRGRRAAGGVAGDALGQQDPPPPPLIVTVNFSGPRSGTGLPTAIDDLDVHRDDIDRDAEWRRLVLIGFLRVAQAAFPGRRASPPWSLAAPR